MTGTYGAFFKILYCQAAVTWQRAMLQIKGIPGVGGNTDKKGRTYDGRNDSL